MVSLNGYSRLDRLVHRIAFANPGVQLAAAEIETRLFGTELEGLALGPAIFITSLPRAGTTALLLALASLPGMATHLYRDMPLVMAPLLWSRLSASFRRTAPPGERAHGDGIMIGNDSPEAFDEVVWRVLWPDHYGELGIALWRAGDESAEARAILNSHFRKIAAVRRTELRSGVRYLSKNNNNIARLDLLPTMFPDAVVLVPLRAPMEHALSLHQQHRNFKERHRKDAFTLRYMADIGHLEFGALHRPILFEGFAKLARGLGPDDFDYWQAYWIAAFEHIRARRDRLHLVVYERLCRNEVEEAAAICRAIGIETAQAPEIAKHFRAPGRRAPALPDHRSDLRERAEALYRELAGDRAPAADA